MAVGENVATLFVDVKARGLVRGREVDVGCIRVVERDLAPAQADFVDGLDPLRGLFPGDLLNGSHCANTRPLTGRYADGTGVEMDILIGVRKRTVVDGTSRTLYSDEDIVYSASSAEGKVRRLTRKQRAVLSLGLQRLLCAKDGKQDENACVLYATSKANSPAHRRFASVSWPTWLPMTVASIPMPCGPA